MSIPRRALFSLRTPRYVTLVPRSRFFVSPTTPPTTGEPLSGDGGAPSKTVSSAPYVVKNPPTFPAPADPFDAQKQQQENQQPKTYSESTKKLVMGVAKLFGYNSRASTAIRETGRMMKGIVDSAQADRAFFYDECKLPPTFQTFFQIHLLYLLILLPRLRALPAHQAPPKTTIPEPLSPSSPSNTNTSSSEDPSGISLSKPNYEAYPLELLNHFFEMAESEMRQVLGRGERERVVRKYLMEFGEQWRGSGLAVDYILGLGQSDSVELRSKADLELAGWVWRNLFQSRGMSAPDGALTEVEKNPVEARLELLLPEQIELVVKFIRREMVRLDKISDVDVLAGNIGVWGKVKE
ncbi:hypothetical protein M231_01460 [Tremella mesenterica]|uniref:Ubiquinol-cytochrome c chaperone domain-containing protein n=1 Tax=Tremella mesenterica TaxID=5217 RepID=A0A4Q1BTJ2_TREME|nr:hypothetical protein M231_01460 [Tremella mesenterica]